MRFGGILFLVALAVWLYSVLDAITADRTQVRRLPKPVWIIIVLMTFLLGAIAWLVAGRPAERSTWPRAGGRPRLGSSGRTAWPSRPDGSGTGRSTFGRPGPPPPDDDPEFLARLERQAAQDHEKLLSSWEEDLRRREEELRRDRGPDDPPDDPRTPS